MHVCLMFLWFEQQMIIYDLLTVQHYQQQNLIWKFLLFYKLKSHCAVFMCTMCVKVGKSLIEVPFFQEKTEEEDEEGGEDDQGVETVPEKPKSSTIGSPEDDLTLRASMYGVLFQSYADKVSFYRSKSELISRLSERKSTYVTEYFFV